MTKLVKNMEIVSNSTSLNSTVLLIKQEGNVLQNLRRQCFYSPMANVSIALCCYWSYFSTIQWIPKNHLGWYPCFNQKVGIIWSFFKIIIRHPGDIQWPIWSIRSDWLKVGIIRSFYQNHHKTPFTCFNLKVGIIWTFSQNYYQRP